MQFEIMMMLKNYRTASMITIEPFEYSEEAYAIAIAINAAVFDEPPEPIEEWRHEDEAWDKDYPFFRDWVKRDGVIIGYVETFQSQFAFHPQKYECRMFIEPKYDADDIRPKILTHTLNRLRDQPLIALKSGMLDNKPEAMRFFEAYDFVTVTEEKLSKLNVIKFDAAQYADLLASVKALGIDIVPLRRLQMDDTDWQHKLYDLDITVASDIPTTGDKRYPSFDDWCERRLAAPSVDPDGWFIAMKDGYFIGHSAGNINRNSPIVQFATNVTAVRREWRRKGIATALKVHIIQYAQAQGVSEIFTSNDAQNPMYQLNLRLGFEPLPSWVRVEKSLVS